MLVLLFVACHAVVAETVELVPGTGGYHACEDSDFTSSCNTDPDPMIPNGYQGFVGYYSLYTIELSESTKVCFDLTVAPEGPVMSASLVLDAIVQTGFGLEDAGPILVKHYSEPSCMPVCGAYQESCSDCFGTLYSAGTLMDGINRTYSLAPAVSDLQTALDAGDMCFCLCLQFGIGVNYEFGVDNLRLVLEIESSETPTPSPTLTPTLTPSPVPTDTPTTGPTLTPTPIPPLPATGPESVLMLLLAITLLILLMRRGMG